MELADERLGRMMVDGQEMIIPSKAGWEALRADPQLAGHHLPAPDLLSKKVRQNAQYPELVSALGFASDRVHFYELLHLNGAFYRAFVEAVVCDSCGHQAVVSATPGVMEIFWGAEDEMKARERCYGLPPQACSACKRPFERRRTVWQVN